MVLPLLIIAAVAIGGLVLASRPAYGQSGFEQYFQRKIAASRPPPVIPSSLPRCSGGLCYSVGLKRCVVCGSTGGTAAGGSQAFSDISRSVSRPYKANYVDRCWAIGNGRLACACEGKRWFQMGPTRTCSTCKAECNRRRGA
jgi:hypothetical protein